MAFWVAKVSLYKQRPIGSNPILYKIYKKYKNVLTIIYKTTIISPPLDQEIGSLISKAKANPEVWERMTESVQFQFHNKINGNYIDHIQVIKNIKKQ